MKKTLAVTTFIIMLLVGSLSTQAQNSNLRGDVNLDGNVNISDVTSLIDYLLSGSWPSVEHDYVDLGLPSGTLWATCNIGATNPEDYGDYFAWGETTPKVVFKQENYKWGYLYNNGSGWNYIYTKYNKNTDGKTILDLEDDAAYVNWGPSWRMPTREQQDELVNQCSYKWTTYNGVKGILFTGPNGNTLFLPAAGIFYQGWPAEGYVGSFCRYFSNTRCSSEGSAYIISEGGSSSISSPREPGHSIRAVRVSQN